MEAGAPPVGRELPASSCMLTRPTCCCWSTAIRSLPMSFACADQQTQWLEAHGDYCRVPTCLPSSCLPSSCLSLSSSLSSCMDPDYLLLLFTPTHALVAQFGVSMVVRLARGTLENRIWLGVLQCRGQRWRTWPQA